MGLLEIYEDTGCEVSALCQNCPLPQCRYDNAVWFRRYQQQSRDRQILMALEQEGLTVEETAVRFSVTVRTVFRAVRRCREVANEDTRLPDTLATFDHSTGYGRSGGT